MRNYANQDCEYLCIGRHACMKRGKIVSIYTRAGKQVSKQVSACVFVYE